MSQRTQVLTLCAVILTLGGGCERQEPAQGKAEEQQMPGTAALICDSTTMLGTASLTITGNPGDAFQISYLCDGQLVSQCTATIAAGQNTASCNTGQNPVPNGGTRTCPVGPGNNNSPAAAVQTSGCG